MSKYIVQSIVLKKDKFTVNEANKKVEELGYNSIYRGKTVDKYKAGQTNNFFRFRQYPPHNFIKDSFRIKYINDDIFLVLAIPKDKKLVKN
jgi:hypothetical protein